MPLPEGSSCPPLRSCDGLLGWARDSAWVFTFSLETALPTVSFVSPWPGPPWNAGDCWGRPSGMGRGLDRTASVLGRPESPARVCLAHCICSQHRAPLGLSGIITACALSCLSAIKTPRSSARTSRSLLSVWLAIYTCLPPPPALKCSRSVPGRFLLCGQSFPLGLSWIYTPPLLLSRFFF